MPQCLLIADPQPRSADIIPFPRVARAGLTTDQLLRRARLRGLAAGCRHDHLPQLEALARDLRAADVRDDRVLEAAGRLGAVLAGMRDLG